MRKTARLIALTGYSNRNVILISGLNTYSAPLSLSERHGSEIKQLSGAFGIARKQNYYLPLVEKSTSYGGL